jgi:hypothetical protein
MKRRKLTWPMAKSLCLALVFSSITAVASAQFDDPGELPLDPDDASMPVDGGLTIIMAAAVGYLARKQHDKKVLQSFQWQIS